MPPPRAIHERVLSPSQSSYDIFILERDATFDGRSGCSDGCNDCDECSLDAFSYLVNQIEQLAQSHLQMCEVLGIWPTACQRLVARAQTHPGVRFHARSSFAGRPDSGKLPSCLTSRVAEIIASCGYRASAHARTHERSGDVRQQRPGSRSQESRGLEACILTIVVISQKPAISTCKMTLCRPPP